MNLGGKTIQPVTIPHSDSLYGSKLTFSALSALSLTLTHIISKLQQNYSQIILKESHISCLRTIAHSYGHFLSQNCSHPSKSFTNALGFYVFLKRCALPLLLSGHQMLCPPLSLHSLGPCCLRTVPSLPFH